jgi:WD40 repeat protein
VLLGVLLKLRTSEGTLIVEVDDPKAIVQVLNEKDEVLIERKGEKGSLTIGVAPGKGRLRVVKDGLELFAQDFSLVSGGKETIKARLETLPRNEFVDVLPRVDLTRDCLLGEWLRNGTAIENKTLNRSPHPTDHLLLPVQVQGEYDLRVTCKRLEVNEAEGNVGVAIVFPVGSKNCMLIADRNGGHLAGGEAFPGTASLGSSKREDQPLLVDGEPCTVLIEVRTSGQSATIKVLRNNLPYLDWQGSETLLGVGGYWNPPQPQQPVLCAHCARVAFSAVELRMISGKFSWVGSTADKPSPAVERPDSQSGDRRTESAVPVEAIVPCVKPVPLDLKPDANAGNLKLGSPLNPAALVVNPAVIKGLRSWTLETCAARGGGGAGQLSPDDSLYATGGRDGVIRFLDSATGKLRIALVNPELDLTALTWSPDSAYVAVGCRAGVVRIWNVAKGTLVIGPTSSSTNEISSLAWSPEGARLAIARRGESAVILWDVREARQSAVLQEQADANRSVNYVAWRADGKQLMATTDLAVRIWDVAGARLVQTLDPQSPEDQAWRAAAAWSPDGKRIATLCGDRKVKVFDSTYKLLMSGEVGHLGDASSSLAWSPDGRHLAGAWFNGAEVRNTTTGLREFWADGIQWGDGGTGVSWSKDSVRLLSTHRGTGTVTVMGPYSQKPLWQLAGKPSYGGTDICMSPDGRQYATAVQLDRLYTWDAVLGAPAHDYGPIFEFRGQVAWSNDGRLAVAGGGWHGNEGGRIWDPGKPGQALVHRDGGFGCAAWSPDGKTLARGGRDVLLWTSNDDDPRQVYHADAQVAKLAWGADNSTLAAGLENNKVVILEMPSGKVLRTLEREGLEGGVRHLAMLPDGRLVAASFSGAVSVWNSKWEPVGDLVRVGINVHIGTTPARGTTSAFATSDGIVLWCADKQAVQKKVGTGPAYAVAWSVPLHRLIAAQDDRIALYDASTGELLAWQIIWWGPGKHLFLSPEGHVRCSPGMSEDVVYVALTDDGRQITLRPTEFAATYGWKNSPERIRLSSATATD